MVDDARFDRFAFCYEAYGVVYIHSSPVTNRSVKESKYTSSGVYFGRPGCKRGCTDVTKEHMRRLCKDG